MHYGAGMYIFGESYVKYSYYAYSKPYCRVPAYLVGMAFGFVNESWASDPSKVPDFSRSQGASFLAAAFVALLACVFAPLSDYRDPESWPPWANGAFLSLVRPTWAAALGVLTTSCALGLTPTLNAFLAAPAVDAVRAADVRRVPVPPGRDQVVRGHRDVDVSLLDPPRLERRGVQRGVRVRVRRRDVVGRGEADDERDERVDVEATGGGVTKSDRARRD